MIAYSPRNYKKLFRNLLKSPVCTVRGMETREIVNANLWTDNPLDRLVTSPSRKMNLPFAIAEWVAMMTGTSAVDFFKPFLPSYSRYSSDGINIDGSYGERLAVDNQLDAAFDKLRDDPSTRQAVIAIYNARDLHGAGGKNTPCTLNLQFLIREREGAPFMDMIATMRSNDVYWGLTYDMFVFTMVQEYMARQCGVGLGNYYHNAGSLHVYSKDYEAIRDGQVTHWPRTMNPMPKISMDDIYALARLLGNVEQEERDNWYGMARIEGWETNEYVMNLAYVCRAYVMRKDHKKESLSCFSMITDGTLRHVLRPRLVSAEVIDEHQRVRTSPRS